MKINLIKKNRDVINHIWCLWNINKQYYVRSGVAVPDLFIDALNEGNIL